MISIILLALAAAFNGAMDTIRQHFPKSVFNEIKPLWLWIWTRSDWLDAFVERDPSKGYKKILGIPRPAPLRDAWHFGKACMIACVIGAVVTYKPIFQWWATAGVYLITWWAAFEGTYYLLVQRKYR